MTIYIPPTATPLTPSVAFSGKWRKRFVIGLFGVGLAAGGINTLSTVPSIERQTSAIRVAEQAEHRAQKRFLDTAHQTRSNPTPVVTDAREQWLAARAKASRLRQGRAATEERSTMMGVGSVLSLLCAVAAALPWAPKR